VGRPDTAVRETGSLSAVLVRDRRPFAEPVQRKLDSRDRSAREVVGSARCQPSGCYWFSVAGPDEYDQGADHGVALERHRDQRREELSVRDQHEQPAVGAAQP